MKTDIHKKYYNTHLAGEYFVAGELFRQGFFAYVSFGNAKSFDILVLQNPEDKSKFARIEVKSSSDPYFTRKKSLIYKDDYKDDHKFHFNIKALYKEIKNGSDTSNKFYVFVVLNGKDNKPDFFIVKAKQVYSIMKKKIEAYESKDKKPSGRWDIKLSDIFTEKNIEKKDNWDCLREYFKKSKK